MPHRLVDRDPRVPPDRLGADLVPPPRFDRVRFETFRPDPDHPSQQEAVEALRAFVAAMGEGSGRRRRSWFGRAKAAAGPVGVYLDGGFGVGKTHLLASVWHDAPAPKLFATFVELTHLVGALGFAQAVDRLSSYRLLCVDEFELDDPGDTVLVSTLLSRLVQAGVRPAATSNTLPGSLGEGRFAAQDFLREIPSLSEHFEGQRIEGEDYRHRGTPTAPAPLSDTVLNETAAANPGASLDHFVDLCRHLPQVHPSRYGALLDGVSLVCLEDVREVQDQALALRLVVLADRLYDRDIPVVAGGVALDRLFAADMLEGGYRKKYLRALSRLSALAREGAALAG